MKYLLTGAQGTGKTSVMNALPDIYLPKLCGITRKCIEENKLSINEHSDNRSQKAIFDAYERQLYSLDSYIAERSLIDVYAYTLHQVKIGKCSPTIAETQYSHLEKFVALNPNAIYFLLNAEFPVVSDGTRSTDKEYQQEIQTNILNTLKQLGCKYYLVSGNVEERVNFITSVINNA